MKPSSNQENLMYNYLNKKNLVTALFFDKGCKGMIGIYSIKFRH